ncbi:MAG: MBL fold metallo-hydrolase [Bacteroidota bacterium]
MALSKTTLGSFELYAIETGDFKLDGGAMFGVVPKTLWSKHIPVDELNRITMTMRCLLIKSNQTNKLYLIDNGLGTKFNQKMTDIYEIDTSVREMFRSFEEHGFTPADVTDVIFTHLHFDHCGGSTFVNDQGDLELTFPNAQYHVHSAQWETAFAPNAREKASFFKENLEPIKQSNRVQLIEDNHEFEEGLSGLTVNGHTKGQFLPKIEGDGTTLVFAADLIPTHVHVPLPWVMGYDMYPTETLLEKERFLREASTNNWYLFLEHDAFEELITVKKEENRFKVANKLRLNQLTSL